MKYAFELDLETRKRLIPVQNDTDDTVQDDTENTEE